MEEIEMTDYQEKQNENVSAPVEEYSFASFAKENFFIIAVLMVLIGIFFTPDPLFIISDYFQIIGYALAYVLGIAACSLFFVSIGMVCINKFCARRLSENIPRRASYTFRFLMIAVALLFFAAIMSGGSHNSAEASNIVSNLRTLQSASLMFYEDSREFIHEIPRNVNILEYLTRYTFNPEAPVWSNYMFIIRDDYWWVGFNLRRARTRSHIRTRLLNRRGIGLFGTSLPEPPPSTYDGYLFNERDDFIWLIVRVP